MYVISGSAFLVYILRLPERFSPGEFENWMFSNLYLNDDRHAFTLISFFEN